MTRQEESQIVSLILAGDTAALNHVYHSLYPNLKKFIAQKVGVRKDVEEISQDTFLSFVDALPLFTLKSSLWTFLVSIAKHEIADYYRKQYAKKTIKAIPLIQSIYDQHLHPSAKTAEQLHLAIEKVFEQLKPSQTRILKLKYQEKKSVKQIATILKLSTKATESKLYRARMAFQDSYKALYGEPQFDVASL